MLPFIALHTIKEIIRPFEIGEIEMKYGLGIFAEEIQKLLRRFTLYR
jgi:hypothetical protein